MNIEILRLINFELMFTLSGFPEQNLKNIPCNSKISLIKFNKSPRYQKNINPTIARMKEFISIILKDHIHVKKMGANWRIFVWHLLINLKNNYLLKNCWSGPIKNVRTLIYKMLHYFKRYRKTPGDIIILHLCTKNLYDTIYIAPEIKNVTEWTW